MSDSRHTVKIPNTKWEAITRILAALPHYAQTHSDFVMRAIDHEIERAWDRFKAVLQRASNPGIPGHSTHEED